MFKLKQNNISILKNLLKKTLSLQKPKLKTIMVPLKRVADSTFSPLTEAEAFLYAPFGEITTEYAPLWQNGTLPKYAFNAKELDEETGMYYYEARYYKPPVFTSRDPMMDQKPWLSPYHYCSNNPVGKVDLSGMMDEDAWVKTSKGIVFDSDVRNQADAVERYGNDASVLPYGSHKINGKDVYLSYNGKYIINGKNYYARDCASFFTRFVKFLRKAILMVLIWEG